MKRLGVIVLFLILIAAGVFWGTKGGEMVGQKDLPIISKEQNSEQYEAAIPQTLRIPKINVETAIEQVTHDAQGRMDVPKDADNVAWYSLGNKPGENGNAVMAGHYDKVSGEPAVFWSVEKLVPGDTIVVQDINNREYTFSVTKVTRYPVNDFPIEDVFGSAAKPMLNLITCQGVWDEATQNYSHRVVVYSEMVQ